MRLLLVACIGMLVTVCAVIFFGSKPHPSPAAKQESASAAANNGHRQIEPPDVDLTGVDHLIAAAIRDAEAMVRRNPESADAWGKLGMVYLAHEFEAAAPCFARAAELAPEKPAWPYLQATSIIRLRPDEAIAPLARAVKLAGSDSPLGSGTLVPQLRLFELYYELGRASEIAEALSQFLAQHPSNGRARLLAARIALREGRLEDCLAELVLASHEAAAKKAVCELRAEVYNRQGRKEEAEDQRRTAASLSAIRWSDPFMEEVDLLETGQKAALSKADKLFVAGRIGDSMYVLEKALEEYPNSDWLWILRARAQIRLRELDAAEASLAKARAINPNSADALFRMGVLNSLRSKPDEAIKWFREVLVQKPDHQVAHYNLGVCYRQLKKPVEAIESFRKAIELQSDYFDALYSLGDLLAEENQLDEARQVLEKARAVRPRDRLVLERLYQLKPAENP